MSSMTMKMVFYNAHDTPLYSSAWTPAADGSYAGTCIFLIILSIISRALLALKAVLERHWLNAHLNRQFAPSPENGRIDGQGQDPDAKLASLVTAPGTPPSSAEKVARGSFPAPLPWRFSVDVPRALIILAFTGVSYLLYVWFLLFFRGSELTRFLQNARRDDHECGVFLLRPRGRFPRGTGRWPIHPMDRRRACSLIIFFI